MKSFLFCVLVVAATCLIGACDSHPWSQTQGLHEHWQHHEGGEHKEAAATAEAPAEKK